MALHHAPRLQASARVRSTGRAPPPCPPAPSSVSIGSCQSSPSSDSAKQVSSSGPTALVTSSTYHYGATRHERRNSRISLAAPCATRRAEKTTTRQGHPRNNQSAHPKGRMSEVNTCRISGGSAPKDDLRRLLTPLPQGTRPPPHAQPLCLQSTGVRARAAA